MSLWEILCKIAEVDGFNLKFDLVQKNIKYKKKFIIEKGKIAIDFIEDCDGRKYEIQKGNIIQVTNNPYDEIQKLYDSYIFSRPNRCNRKSVFRAKKSDELSYEQLTNGEDRELARCKLEGFIILNVVIEKLIWKETTHWFWKGNNGLIIFKEWVLKERIL